MFQVIRRRRGPSCAPAASSDRSREALKLASAAIIDKHRIATSRQIAINGHMKFNLTTARQQLNGRETLVIIMIANKYAFWQITRRRFLNEWEAFKKVITRRNIRRRITIPLSLSNLKLLRRITRTKNILHRNFMFFFQAEDGIRDYKVTGVQTCALPI